MRVLIATPTAGGIVTAAYAQTLAAATIAITEAGGSYRYLSVDGADVVTARNLLAHEFLSDTSCDCILFLDSDMLVSGSVFRHFIALDVPMVGAAYADRRLDLKAYGEAYRDQLDEDAARARASSYTVRLQPGEVEVRNLVTPVQGIGFGCVLIRRSVFTMLIENGQVPDASGSALRRNGIKDRVLGFFDEITTDDGDRLSEDFAFCERVLSLGSVPVLAYVGGGVGHVGPFTYSAPYIERLKSGKI